MPSHIKHMDKMHKILVISNSPLSRLSVGISFITQTFILKIKNFIVSRGIALLQIFSYMYGPAPDSKEHTSIHLFLSLRLQIQ